MPYKARDLSVLAYANGFTLWHYKTDADSVLTAGYFDPAVDMLRKGDLILATVDANGTPGAEIAVVRTSGSGSVVVDDVTAA